MVLRIPMIRCRGTARSSPPEPKACPSGARMGARGGVFIGRLGWWSHPGSPVISYDLWVTCTSFSWPFKPGCSGKPMLKPALERDPFKPEFDLDSPAEDSPAEVASREWCPAVIKLVAQVTLQIVTKGCFLSLTIRNRFNAFGLR